MIKHEKNNKKDKMKQEDNKLIVFIKENCTWIIAIITALSLAISYVLKFTEYITSVFYFNYFEIDIGLYRYNDIGFLYNIFLSFVFLLLFISNLICWWQLSENRKGKIVNILVFFLSNIFIIFLFNKNLNFINGLISFILLSIIEKVLVLAIKKMYFKYEKSAKELIKESIINCLKVIPVIIIIVILLLGFKTSNYLSNLKRYRVIDNNKVVVYSNNDYYIILDCEIIEKENKLIIHKGEQTKIENTNISSKKIKFDNVELKED